MVDKKIGVASAGDLTRHLVEGLYEIRIVEGCCADSEKTTGWEVPHFIYDKVGVDWLLGRILAQDTVLATNFVAPAGTAVTRDLLERIRSCRIKPRQIMSPLSCKSLPKNGGVCADCYGLSPTDSAQLPAGYPVGILAAQSIGERGTQLSMRGFHTGEREIDLEDIRTLILNVCNPEDARALLLGQLAEQARAKTMGEVDFSSAFWDLILSVEAYRKDVNLKHFELLLAALHLEKGVSFGLKRRASDTSRRGFLAVTSYGRTASVLRKAVLKAIPDTAASQKTSLMLDRGHDRP